MNIGASAPLRGALRGRLLGSEPRPQEPVKKYRDTSTPGFGRSIHGSLPAMFPDFFTG